MTMDKQLPVLDDRLFWIWRRDNPRLAQGVSEDAFRDIARLAASEAFTASAERLHAWAEQVSA